MSDIIKPFEYHRAELIAAKARDLAARSSAVAWSLDSHMRSWRRATTPEQRAEAMQEVLKASNAAERFIVEVHHDTI